MKYTTSTQRFCLECWVMLTPRPSAMLQRGKSKVFNLASKTFQSQASVSAPPIVTSSWDQHDNDNIIMVMFPLCILIHNPQGLMCATLAFNLLHRQGWPWTSGLWLLQCWDCKHVPSMIYIGQKTEPGHSCWESPWPTCLCLSTLSPCHPITLSPCHPVTLCGAQ